MMKQKIYIETSVLSYLTSNPSRDVVIAGKQQITQEWWSSKRHVYELYISELVIEEIRRGDEREAEKRLQAIRGISIAEINEDILRIARNILKVVHLPQKAINDAFHIATAIHHRMHFLLSWNCKHIANPNNQRPINNISMMNGWNELIICTPLELLGE